MHSVTTETSRTLTQKAVQPNIAAFPEWCMNRLTTLLLFLAALALAAATPVQAARIALVVGIGGYVNAPPLPNPPNDAALMADTLEAAGFEVTRLIDPDLDGLKRAMIEFGRKLRGGETEAGLFFYAGHGIQVKGENYLIPADASLESEDEIDLQAVNVNDFLSVMESSRSKVNIVILDACRDNPFASSSRGGPRGLAPVDAPKGTYIAYSTSPGSVALDGSGSNSPYTKALASAMLEPGLPIERVFKNARSQVLEATADRQLPWETSSITGEFFFVPEGGAAQSGQAPKESLFQQLQIDPGKGSAEKLSRLEIPAAPARPSPSWAGETCAGRSRAAAGGDACVSSVLDPQFGNRYGPGNLFDGDPATAWVEGARDDGVGEALVVRFAQATEVSRIQLMNGYNKNRDIYAKNNRVKSLVLTASGGERFDVSMSDDGGWQTIELPQAISAEWISLEIGSVFRGSKYRDTAISEMRIE